MKLTRLVVSIRSSLWYIPVLCVLGGIVLSFGTIAVDRSFDYELIPVDLIGGPDAALEILGIIAASMVSLAALVLTITMVVVQLAMGQFSPRIVQRILQDKPSQFAIGLFVATFVHAILAIREVTRDGAGGGRVPGVALSTAFVLVLVSIAVLVIYVNHIGRALRVSALIELVGRDTRQLLDRKYPDRGRADDAEPGGRVVTARESGVITIIDHEALVEEARRAGCVLELQPALGEFVPAGAPLFRVRGEPTDLDGDRLQEALVIKLEPTLDEDVAYGIRMLVDIATRSVADSPFQDPSTAVQAIDRIHDILRQLVGRPFPDGRHRDDTGEIRLVVRSMSWEGYVHLAFDEIRLAGAGSPQIARRMQEALADLRSVAPNKRVAILDQEVALLSSASARLLEDPHDVEFARQPDRDGIGVAAGTDGDKG